MTQKTDALLEQVFPHDEPLPVQLERHRQYLRRALKSLRASEEKLPWFEEARGHADLPANLIEYTDNMIKLHKERIAVATRQRDLAMEMIDRLTSRGPTPDRNG